MPDKEQMRMFASMLVTQIVAWGGRGKDVAVFLGVSETTISHWRNLETLEGRKPSIPTDDQVLRLLGILKFRIGQNLGRINTVLEIGRMGSVDARYTALLAGVAADEFLFYGKRFQDHAQGYEDSVAETMEGFRTIQEKGGDRVLRSLLGPVVVKWGEIVPEATKPPSDDPIDLDKLQAKIEVGKETTAQIEAYSAAFRKMIETQAREVLLRKHGKSGDPTG
jgi:hypothetical protein